MIATYSYDAASLKLRRAGGLPPLPLQRGRRVVHADRDYYFAAEGPTGRHSQWRILEVRKNGDTDPLKAYAWDLRYIDAPAVRWYDEDTW